MRDPKYKKPTDRIVTIPVSPDLHRKIRIRAAELGITIKELGTRALEEAVRPLSTRRLRLSGKDTDYYA